jgi:hypothetical protein
MSKKVEKSLAFLVAQADRSLKTPNFDAALCCFKACFVVWLRLQKSFKVNWCQGKNKFVAE